jgi:hypothetical protein
MSLSHDAHEPDRWWFAPLLYAVVWAIAVFVLVEFLWRSGGDA